MSAELLKKGPEAVATFAPFHEPVPPCPKCQSCEGFTPRFVPRDREIIGTHAAVERKEHLRWSCNRCGYSVNTEAADSTHSTQPARASDAAARGDLVVWISHVRAFAASISTPRTLDDWNEGIGPALWWTLPVAEPPYVGTPLDEDFPATATHFTTLYAPGCVIADVPQLSQTQTAPIRAVGSASND